MAASPENCYDPAVPRQTFEHWDAPLVRWLEEKGLASFGMCEKLDQA